MDEINAIENVEQDNPILDVTERRHIESFGGAQVELPYFRKLGPIGESAPQPLLNSLSKIN